MPKEFPKAGLTHADVLARMQQMRSEDADWRGGRTWSLVYHASDELTRLVKDAYALFHAENALSPFAFPSLRRFEGEVLDLAAGLFHAPEGKGSLTSGGSESILMAVKSARERARRDRPEIKAPEMIVPRSVHPAFEKAGYYLDVKVVHAPVGADGRVEPDAVRALVNDNTILLVGSAPSYPHGVVDPIPELGALALERGLWLHVDACVGGFLLPWLERLGKPIPAFDFRVPGVTSMSADLHKYGFAAKGASVVLYRDRELRRNQFFVYGDWPGGLYGSPSATGTRPGGAIAAAWAVMHALGEDGYLRLAREISDTTDKILAGIRATPGLRVIGEPVMSVFAFTSDVVDVYELGDALTQRGWAVDRQQLPPALHCMVTPAHTSIADLFVADLRECTASLAAGGRAPEGSAAMYGMIGAMPDREAVASFIYDFMDTLYQPD